MKIKLLTVTDYILNFCIGVSIFLFGVAAYSAFFV
ncbi:uncharacterized protein METZ01_LOCUS329539 [marine metagenome]|uniref:Uncharacterized protein n=1 Tax=marine metagenome TaxID=408172 RepID=A0A382PVI8_9ZZZZ